mmetsp:Transcript_59990/g.111282  ORF Transcript_59990/g.111282 Transcript_59990/m.111282 type:complete len:335 (-) Transcript_59990:166-1170(-)
MEMPPLRSLDWPAASYVVPPPPEPLHRRNLSAPPSLEGNCSRQPSMCSCSTESTTDAMPAPSVVGNVLLQTMQLQESYEQLQGDYINLEQAAGSEIKRLQNECSIAGQQAVQMCSRAWRRQLLHMSLQAWHLAKDRRVQQLLRVMGKHRNLRALERCLQSWRQLARCSREDVLRRERLAFVLQGFHARLEQRDQLEAASCCFRAWAREARYKESQGGVMKPQVGSTRAVYAARGLEQHSQAGGSGIGPEDTVRVITCQDIGTSAYQGSRSESGSFKVQACASPPAPTVFHVVEAGTAPVPVRKFTPMSLVAGPTAQVRRCTPGSVDCPKLIISA